jgi:hypothetical protein
MMESTLKDAEIVVGQVFIDLAEFRIIAIDITGNITKLEIDNRMRSSSSKGARPQALYGPTAFSGWTVRHFRCRILGQHGQK